MSNVFIEELNFNDNINIQKFVILQFFTFNVVMILKNYIGPKN